jgi:hypothetical protein
MKNTPSTERNRQETEFFSTMPWNELKPCDRGIKPLRERLRQRYFVGAKKGLLVMAGKLDDLLLQDKYASLSTDKFPTEFGKGLQISGWPTQICCCQARRRLL